MLAAKFSILLLGFSPTESQTVALIPKSSFWQRTALAGSTLCWMHILTKVACLVLLLDCAACTQMTNPAGNQRSSSTLPQRLSFRYDATNAQYRQQLLGLCPLGTSQGQVERFVEAELQAGTHRSESIFDPGFFKQPNTPLYIHVQMKIRVVYFDTNYLRPSDLREQPPHAKIFTSRGSFIKGTIYMNPHFQSRPYGLNRWIELSAFYIFSPDHRLIDVVCLAGAPYLVGP